jgi:hypothetical protein
MTSSSRRRQTRNGQTLSVHRTSRRRARTQPPSPAPAAKHLRQRPTMRQTCTEHRRPYSCGSERSSRFKAELSRRMRVRKGRLGPLLPHCVYLFSYFLLSVFYLFSCVTISVTPRPFSFSFVLTTGLEASPPATLCLHTYEDGHRTFSLPLTLPSLLSFLSSRQLFMIPSPYPDCILLHPLRLPCSRMK